MAASREQVSQLEEKGVGAVVVSTAVQIVKNRPVSVSLWVLGLLLAAFATGFSVDEATAELYSVTLRQAEDVDRQELSRAVANFRKAEDRHYNAKGWFSCDGKCKILQDKRDTAQAEVHRVQQKRDAIMLEARKEVGIWSKYGVRDIRNAFWSAWQSGTDMAKRWTMMDALFMAMPGRQEEGLMHMVIQLVFKYVVNLTIGMVSSFLYFVYNVYVLVVSYGESLLSGLAFFLLVLVAGMATLGTYLAGVFGTVAGGGYYLVKQAEKKAALEGARGGARGGPPRRVQYQQYGGGPVGGFKRD